MYAFSAVSFVAADLDVFFERNRKVSIRRRFVVTIRRIWFAAKGC